MIIEAVALYWPMALCGALYWIVRSRVKEGEGSVELKRALVAAMMAGSWVAATLPWLNDLCVAAGFWGFDIEHGYRLKNLPLSLYVGWIILWGVLPALLVSMKWLKNEIWKIVAVLVLLDLVTMNLFVPVMTLTSIRWLWGELLIVIVGLLPAVCLAKWVIYREQVVMRAGLISAAFVMLILVVLPTSIVSVRVNLVEGWSSYQLLEKCLWGILLTVVGVPGIAGVVEFVRVGKGTPIPYDAPENLVTSGVYSYVQNPMQLSMVMVLLVWGWIFGSWFVIGLGVVSIVYSVGLARWSEGQDLEQRFGSRWIDYDRSISMWKLRFRPVWGAIEPARIYIDADCEVCRPIAHWIQSREPVALVVCSASDWREKEEGIELSWIIQRGIDAGGGGVQVKS